MAKFLNYLFYFVFISYCSSFELDILKEYGLLRNNINNLNNHFVRLNSYKEKSFTRSSTFNSETVEQLTVEVIFRLDKSFNQIFDIFSMFDKSYDNIFWVGVEKTQEIAVYTKANNKIFATFKNAKVVDEKWHKVVVQYNRGTVKLWLDGQLYEQSTKFHEQIQFQVPEVGSVIGYMDEAPTEIYGNFDLKKLWIYTDRIRPDESYNGDMPAVQNGSNILSSNINKNKIKQSQEQDGDKE